MLMPLAIEDRVDTLEAVLGEFIVSTNRALIRMERGIAGLRVEMKDFKDKIDNDIDEMKENRKKMYRQWGDLANKMGTIVEDMVAPNVPGIARDYFGIKDLDFFAVRVKKVNIKDRSLRREFDVIGASEDSFILTEVKSNPRQSYVDEFLDVLKQVPDYFAESEGKRLIPIFASLYIPENILSFLTRNGIFAMGIKDDSMALLNFEEIDQAGRA
jgi:hypothetical protein